MTKYISKILNTLGHIGWKPDENKTCNTLIERQSEIVKTRACGGEI